MNKPGRWVEWVDPDENYKPVVMRCPVEEAIKIAREAALRRGYPYENDRDALEDFLTVYLAKVVE